MGTLVERETVAKMASLAHIRLSEDELGHFIPRFNQVAELLASLADLPLAQEVPTSSSEEEEVVGLGASQGEPPSSERDDELRDSLPPELVLEAAPRRQGFAFQVPRIIEQRS